jgi:hypothetical protein
MSEFPSTSWANWAWQAYKDGRLVEEADLPGVQPDAAQAHIDAAVKAERDRCAKVALIEGEAMQRAARAFMPPGAHADDALYHMHVGGEQTAERIAAAIRGGQQP